MLYLLCLLLSFMEAGAAPPRRPSGPWRPPRIISINLDPQEQLNTYFRVSARERNFSAVREALAKGAEIDSRSDRGETALMYAARRCSPKMAQLLLGRGAKATLRDQEQQTALIYAARGGCEKIVRLLLKSAVVDPLHKDVFGKTALHYAREGMLLEVNGPFTRIHSALLLYTQNK